MADTITILDGLENAQTTAASATLCDIDSATISLVGTYPIHVPISATQGRVIFNNKYDPDGAACHCRVRVTPVTGMTTTTVTKAENVQPMEWTVVAQNTVVETGTFTLTNYRSGTIHIDCCLSTAVAHTGTQIIVQIASEASTDASWTTVTDFIGPTGTPILGLALTTANQAATILAIDNPVTNNFDNDGKFKFISNTTASSCEIIYQTANSGD